ncbi:hypothetical protein BHE74_00008658 [Ensete ventricosum]|nr:hypothetical protein BHE74_00008658 [Ensete ventricosum]
MESENIECVSVSDGMVEEEDVAHIPHPFVKPRGNGSGTVSAGVGGGGVPAPVISPVARVHELLECPVCTNSMYPPIHQVRFAPSGICCQIYSGFKCLALEKVAESLELPCRYLSLGCPEIFPYYSKLKHEAQCNFRPYNCPYAGSECSVVGDVPFLVAHLRDDHKLGMAPVYMAFLRFMGDEREARSYGYSLEVGSNGRKLIWEGIPRSIRDSHRKVRDSHDGLVIQRNMALFFSGGDRKELKLRVTGRIWKEQQQQQQQQQNLDAGVSSFTPNPCC